ncbi:MAG: hypothetical protein HOW73_33050 [Polyangiaceae bacterium]|nr:hypothetical protein [Polyangiaceae bacterium]
MTEPGAPTPDLLYAADGYVVRVVVPTSTRSSPPLESVDVSRLPGARIVALARFDADGVVAFGGCARGPSGKFAPGLEGVLFDRATALALKTLEVAPSNLTVERDVAHERSFERRATAASDKGAVVVHQLLTFDGPERDLVLCTVACAGRGCEAAEVRAEGTLPTPPAPNIVLRAFFYTAEHPFPVLGGGAALCLLLVAVILWRRPYPRP